jgi:recombination protein RecT
MTTKQSASTDLEAASQPRTKQAQALDHYVAEIRRSEPQFALALPAHVTPERFTRVAVTVLRNDPKLQACSLPSILSGLMQSAQLGVEIGGVRQQAYLVPRWNSKLGCQEATFQLGYRGMIDLAARAGITVTVDEVCEHDTIDYELGTNAYLRHKPALANRGGTIGYYAVASFRDGRPAAFTIIGRGEAEAFRDRFAASKTKDGVIYGPWDTDFDAMARKTAVRQLLNYLPQSIELQQALSADEGGPVVLPALEVSTVDVWDVESIEDGEVTS